ncbi:TIR domain-containing protein [Altererythrobacter salegens]|uniref:TIR domain-containing protein n=1 Tax=Croceibacterium salegens TaxID=1737568 RepID=A0A6I4SWY9_9SPHN|nr:TIR domain-containing protein [Croceibacterium salegens]MXO60373.1 TIR domain-containing protein [Croceibacterium salegens]
MADVFISYSRSDRAVAERLSAALAGAGVEVWMDSQITGGTTFADVTEDALNNASKVIVLWSKDSVQSAWVRDEATIAREQQKLVPLTIDGAMPPMGFRQIQLIDVGDWAKGNDSTLPHSVAVAIEVDLPEQSAWQPESPKNVGAKQRTWFLTAIGAAILLVLGAGYFALTSDETSHVANENGRTRVVVHALAANLSDDPSEAALAQGITDELIVRLRSIPQLQIATAAPDGSVPGDDFDNAYVVDGNIRSEKEKLRVAVRLTAPGGEILWSETFDRTLVDLFDVQQSMASSIANALSVPFDVGYQSTRNGGTSNPEAYAAYMQFVQNSLSFDSQVPLSFLKRAIELDPTYVRAKTGLSGHATVRVSFEAGLTEARANELVAIADEASKYAVETAPDLAISHAARAWFWLTANNIPSAADEIEQAKKLDPGNDPQLRDYFSTFAGFLGRSREALAIRRSSQMIDPAAANDPYLVYDLLAVGEYQPAIDHFERLERLNAPGLQSMVAHAFMSFLMQGKEEEGLEFFRMRAPPMFVESFVAARDQDEFSGMSLAQLRNWADRTYGAGGHLAVGGRATYEAYFGRDQVAVNLLRIAMERPGGNGNFNLWHPAVSEARKLPEFRKLLADLRIPEVWRESGDWGDYCRPTSNNEIECT